MEGKYMRKLLRKLRKKLPEGMPVKVIFSQTIKPSLHEYYLIFVDGFQYTVYEKSY